MGSSSRDCVRPASPHPYATPSVLASPSPASGRGEERTGPREGVRARALYAFTGLSGGLLDDVHDALDARGALGELRFFFVVELEADDLLHAFASDDHGHAHEEVFVAVLAVEVGRGGED